ncbi:MAG: DUF1460 domain-containing protein [Ignavibacteriae bacterium]|nr:DUF1460 domain-containing protein [Ignavibacteriota bacterium]NOG99350.1 DUF1460 domain-containing protein [Ignavibacteriota bacterium]
MKKRITLLLYFILVSFIYAQNENKIFDLTNYQIDSLLTEVSKKDWTVTEKMEYFSSLFLGMPYNLTCSGDGPYALYETEPLVNFQQTNCMVYCEHVLALSISDSWDNFFNNLQQIRYEDGMIGMRTRNHYTMGDWVTENDWLLNDVTKLIGGEHANAVTRTISHKEFFKGKGISDLRYVKPDRELTIFYIPFEKLAGIKENIKSGDILSLIFAELDNIFSAHMLMAFWKDGDLYFRESSMSKMTTFDTKFEDWLKKYNGSKRYAGLSFMRVNDSINKPGKIILPRNIDEIKNSVSAK